MTLDHPVRSGLCHGPSCDQSITERSGSQDFCSDGCQARWQAANVGAEPDPALFLPAWRVYDTADGCWTPVTRPSMLGFAAAVDREMERLVERVEALRPDDLIECMTDDEQAALSLLMNGNVYLKPSKPAQRPWWQRMIWRRNG